MATTLTSSNINAIGTSNEVEAQAHTENQTAQTQQNLNVEHIDPKKKRKQNESRVAVWEYFDQLKDDKGKLFKAKYKYCAKCLNAEPKKMEPHPLEIML